MKHGESQALRVLGSVRQIANVGLAIEHGDAEERLKLIVVALLRVNGIIVHTENEQHEPDRKDTDS